jgi:hypothetical protein
MSDKLDLTPGLSYLKHEAELATFKMPMPIITPISVQNAENFQDGIRQVIEGLQSNLKPDEQLLVYYTNGVEMIRVGHILMSSTNVAVITGIDSEGNQTRVVAHFHALQFVCKVVKSDQNEKTKIGFSTN